MVIAIVFKVMRMSALIIFFVALALLCRNPDYAGIQWKLTMVFAVLLPQMGITTMRINVSHNMNRFELISGWITGTIIIFSCGFTDW